MNEPALDIYLLCTTALVFNLVFLVGATARARVKSKTVAVPEDGAAFKLEVVERESADVLRAQAAHRNALENVPVFLILGFLHVMTGASETSAMAYFVTFTAARWLHSLCYLRGLQPWRTMFFAISWFAMIGLAIRLAMTALT